MNDSMNQVQNLRATCARGTSTVRPAAPFAATASASLLPPPLSSAFTMNVFSPDKPDVYSPAVRPGPSTGTTLVLIVLSLLLIAMTARAHQVETINSFSVTDYTGYVIDSDAQW